MVGSNLEEQKFFARNDPDVDRLTDDSLSARLAHVLDVDPVQAVSVYREARAARGESTSPADLWFAILGDLHLRVPMMRLAEAQAAHTPAVYTYLFTWQSPDWNGKLGAGHTVEVPFEFGTLDEPDSEAERLSTRMLGACIAFGVSGTPRTADLPDWAPYSTSRRCTMLLGATTGAMDAPYEPERRFVGDAAALLLETGAGQPERRRMQ